ncbi:MAG: glycosyl hydrolase [Nitrospirae bacterium]|nr:MAG: glycosyl hydrolase [Nitrospirota bacterium]
MTLILLALPLAWLLAGAILFLAFQRARVLHYWREPMVAAPVLVVESDDWGPGFPGQAEALARLRRLLRSHRDRHGRGAVMTLGVLLAAPDRRAMGAGDPLVYRAVTLEDRRYAALRAEMAQGVAEGVFSLQLHGREHFWPPALVARARTEAEVRRWLTDPGEPEIYALAPYLQSRWIDAAALPSRPLPRADLEQAVREEAALYRDLFGTAPRVVVPPTFVWPEALEEIWARAGVEVLVTPGTRYTGRGAAGELVSDGSVLCNGDRLGGGLVAAVRNGYYEPSLGHGREEALRAFEENLRCGRPTLLESHAFNYVGEAAASGMQGLARLLEELLERHPNLRFLSTLALMRELMAQDGNRHLPLGRRLAFLAARLLAVWQLHRWRLFTGASLWLRLLAALGRLPAAGEEGSP